MFTMVGQGGRADLSGSWTGVDILGRFVTAFKPSGAYDIPSDDIVTYNRNYKYCIPYTDSGIVRMTNRVSDTPTEWGKRGDGKYYEKPYLNADERKAALILSQSLKKGKAAIEAGERDSQKVIDIIRQNLETEPMARIDYVEVVDFENIQRTAKIEGEVLVAIAVYIGKTRLIDNFIVNI